VSEKKNIKIIYIHTITYLIIYVILFLKKVFLVCI